MSETQLAEQNEENNKVEILIGVLNKEESFKDIKNFDLRQAFHELDIQDKIQVLYETVLSNASSNNTTDEKLDLFEKTERISFYNWFKKVVVIFLAFTGSVSFLTFIFMIIKNGAFSDISVVASFFKTMHEVLNVIFLTK